MYRYETHMHSLPVSKCAKVGVRESLEFYKAQGYAGVFLTNHFLDGNISISRDLPYEDRLNFYYADFEEAQKIGRELGLSVFDGVEMSYNFSDFLVYGLHKDWYMAHPEIEEMPKSKLLPKLMDLGALVIHAHPFREAKHIDHIRLFPRCVHGVEVYNACRTDFENAMALQYADSYGLLHFCGTDNHVAGNRTTFAGMECETPLVSVEDFVQRVLKGEMKLFRMELPQAE